MFPHLVGFSDVAVVGSILIKRGSYFYQGYGDPTANHFPNNVQVKLYLMVFKELPVPMNTQGKEPLGSELLRTLQGRGCTH